MEVMDKVAPRPWTAFGRDIEDASEDHIATTYAMSQSNPVKGEQTAAFIVKAVNSHAKLVDTLKALDAMGGLGYSAHSMINVALAAVEAK